MKNAANCARLMNTEEQQVQSLISQLSCILVRRIKMRSTEGVDHDREVQTSLKSAGLVSRTQSDVIDVNLSNARSDAPPQSIQDTRLKSISQSVSQFLPARRYASAGNSDRNVSVCPSVRHAPVLCQNEES